MSSLPEHPNNGNGNGNGRTSKNSLATKPRHPLPVTVQAERGLREGEVWHVDNRLIIIFFGERLTSGGMYEARVDLRAHGGNADLQVKIVQASVGMKSGVTQGYLHVAKYRSKHSQDAARMIDAYGRLNPGRAQAHSPTSKPPRAKPAPAPAAATPKPAKAPAPQAKPQEPETPKAEARTPEPIQPVPSKPAPLETKPREPAPRQPEPRRREPRPVRPKGALPDSAHRVFPQIAPGTPPAILLHFPDHGTLRTHIRIESGDVFLYAAPASEIEEQRAVVLHLQLPQGAFVTIPAKVLESNARRCSFVARRADAATLNTLNASLRFGLSG